jgi:hypothetical protein
MLFIDYLIKKKLRPGKALLSWRKAINTMTFIFVNNEKICHDITRRRTGSMAQRKPSENI